MNENQTILLVDDSADDLFLVRAAFRSADLTNPIQEVCDGAQAIDYLQGKPPFDDRARFPLPVIMLLDLNMPMLDGFQVLEWLRVQPGLKRLTVIIFSASLREQDVDRAFDLGANAFLVKPTSLERLVDIAGCLRGWIGCTQFPQVAETPKVNNSPAPDGVACR